MAGRAGGPALWGVMSAAAACCRLVSTCCLLRCWLAGVDGLVAAAVGGAGPGRAHATVALPAGALPDGWKASTALAPVVRPPTRLLTPGRAWPTWLQVLVGLITPMMTESHWLRSQGRPMQVASFAAFYAGAGAMALLGKWV